VLSEQESDLVTHCLRGVINGGTGASANFGKQAAGKTGTTQDNRDAWFAGYTPKLTAAVWMGYVGAPGAEVRFMGDVHGRQVTGGSFPAEIWKKFMRNATDGLNTGSFTAAKSFPGKVLNKQLSTTSSTVEGEETSSTSSTSSTVPGESTSSTAPTATTATTAPPSTTATTAPTSTTGPGPIN
jgi:membrane peptidoglycan carboxypeptidase